MTLNDELFEKYLDQLEEVVKAGRAHLQKCENVTTGLLECGTPDGENRLARAYKTLVITERPEVVNKAHEAVDMLAKASFSSRIAVQSLSTEGLVESAKKAASKPRIIKPV